MNVYDSRGKPVQLGESIGKGGEATVYRMAGQPGRLAKIYEPEPRPNYAYKLDWMVNHPPENPTASLGHESLAWPDGLLYDNRRRLKGYRMPLVEKAVPLLEVFNPRRRAVVLPQFDRRYLHRTARNLAAAVSALHHSGYVAGDINESNVLVTSTALVTIIDTDSFQVRAERGATEIIYHCPVGKPEYTPPELQKQSLAQVTRLPDHDAFGLAVLIFQLLMEGSHPFRAQWLAAGDPPPIEKRISEGLFPYVDNPDKRIAPPKNGVSFDTLHPNLAELFRRCFVNGHLAPRWRPGPELWAKTIEEAERSLVLCAEGHYFSGHLPECPYCAAKSKAAQQQARSAPAGNSSRRPGWQSQRRPAPAYNRAGPASAGRGTVPPAAARGARAGQGAVPPTGAAAQGGTQAPPPFFYPHNPAPAQGPSSGQSRNFRWRGRWGSAPQPAAAGVPSGSAGRVGGQAAPPRATINFGIPGMPGVSGTFGFPQGQGAGGVLQNYSQMVRQSMIQRARDQFRKGIIYGGGYGAAIGMVPGVVVATINWFQGTPLDWTLLVALGGLSAGLLRGWSPGYKLSGIIDKYVGWKRFWEAFFMVLGGVGGFILSLPFIFLVFPAIFGMILGGKFGKNIGSSLYGLGNSFGWEKIWATLSALGSAGLGFGIAKLTNALGLMHMGAKLAEGLMAFSATTEPYFLLFWALAGLFGGAVAGAASGMITDWVARFTGLLD